ncbi:MAG: PIN domain-containing protein [Candidatus Bathyarchaeia archaeon]|nr:PIN domain-containing protein [Candidatus Bathyarchaeota archaeon]
MRVFLDTWVLIELYKRNPYAINLIEAVKKGLEAHISHITIAELVNIINREYGEREARVQYVHLKRLPLIKDGTTEEISRDAGLYKTKYRFSLADSIILATAIEVNAQALITGGDKQYEEEWKNVTEIEVKKLQDYMKTLKDE